MNIEPSDLLARGDIAALAGVALSTINQWAHRHADFPAPFARTSAGDIYLRAPVVEWLTKTGRLPQTTKGGPSFAQG
jgi:hypothetical protein